MQNSKFQIPSSIAASFAILFSIFYFLFSFLPARAAELIFDPAIVSVAVGERFEIGVFVETGNERANAVEGEVLFPEDLLGVERIHDANSVVPLWIEKPNARSGALRFSGMVPQGFEGNKMLFRVMFKGKRFGEAFIEARNLRLLRNDGAGTPVPFVSRAARVVVASGISEGSGEAAGIPDAEPPEPFDPQIGKDEAIFEGKYFLAFSAADAGSGIDHFEVCEGWNACVQAESPYLLRHQALDREIIVKAFDAEGNVRAAIVPAENPRPWYRDRILLGILTGGFVAALICIFLALSIYRKRASHIQ